MLNIHNGPLFILISSDNEHILKYCKKSRHQQQNNIVIFKSINYFRYFTKAEKLQSLLLHKKEAKGNFV